MKARAKATIKHPQVDDVAALLGRIKDGHRYRMTIDSLSGRRIGVVQAKVRPPEIKIIPGEVTFVMEGETLNENALYPGPVDKIVDLEEIE